jgi:hypothetical protein
VASSTTENRVPRPYVGADRAAPKGIQGGSYTARSPEGADGEPGSVVVFLIGMRINRWRRTRSWWPVFVAMPKMLRELAGRPDAGLLGAKSYWAGRDFLVVQYWRSAEHLGRFARDPQMAHQPAWAAFNKATAADGDVGIWHETYVVPAASIESLYGNMPQHGLGAAVGSEPRGAHSRTAAQDEMGQRDPEYVAGP